VEEGLAKRKQNGVVDGHCLRANGEFVDRS
jgi:hypothetical protein